MTSTDQKPTPAQVVEYLEDLHSRLVSALERSCIMATIVAVKRLANDPGAVAWWRPRLPIFTAKPPKRRRHQHHDFCPKCGSKDFSGCPVCEDYL